jgi:hypothetical protein
MAEGNSEVYQLPRTGQPDIGNSPEVSETTLQSENRVVSSVQQALDVCSRLEWDAEKIVRNAAKITSQLQGAKPYIPGRLQQLGKAYKTNISTGAYATTLRRVAPRLYMPLLNASTVTAAQLPAGWPNGEEKSKFFQEAMTQAWRSWPKWKFFVRGTAKEVVNYGWAFWCWTDRYEWRPHLARMDRGFVPKGTEIMDPLVPFFELRWDYQPAQLLSVARGAIDAGIDGWRKDAVAAACQWADLPPASNTPPTEWRKWEELIREQVWDNSSRKGYRVIQAKHLFVTENSGKVSHFILWPDGGKPDVQLLYEKHDAYESMAQVMNCVAFDWGDGTVHGSWGAGHLLYDLAIQTEKIRCDAIDNLRASNKARLQVKDPKDINDVKTVVNDEQVIVSGAEFANNLGGTQQNVDGYLTLDQYMTRLMEQKVGAYIPPIPLQNSDIKAAQVNAAVAQEQETAMDTQEMFLSQMAVGINEGNRRMLQPENPDPVAVRTREKLLERLSEEEIQILIEQPAIQSVVDFTPAAAMARAQFAAAKKGDARFRQVVLARMEAEGVPSGGTRLADAVVIPESDPSEVTAQQRQQITENATMLLGMEVPVVTNDNHWVHFQTLQQPLQQAIASGMLQQSQIGLRHAVAHYTAGVAQKTWPDDQINPTKAWIADAQKAIEAMAQQQAQQQGQQQMAPGILPMSA